MARLIEASRSIYVVVIVGSITVVLGITAAAVYFNSSGATGDTLLKLFGQSFESANVGIAAIFIGGVVVVMLIRRVMRSLDHTVRTESAERHREEETR
ncbi:hypothetical protein [Streptomyces sp. H27-S2]|uniref:hypothetical protein n=1 Tax=Streptomyces antarcticus TaxID=2996458 RepID=UPI0022716F70|nr:hypothetical protein [Streptomyces sp. H27-S2]MCY0949858.1 hypothetical protein [Streptomyces sp. H27-S2]